MLLRLLGRLPDRSWLRKIEPAIREIRPNIRLLCANVRRRSLLERVSRQRPVRVTFMLVSYSFWPTFRPLYEAMDADPDFDPQVLCIKRVDVSFSDSAEDLATRLSTEGVRVRVFSSISRVHGVRTQFSDVDVLVYTLGSGAFPDEIRIETLGCRKLCIYVPYAYLLTNASKQQYGQLMHKMSWIVQANSNYDKREHQKAGVGEDNIVVTGYIRGEDIRRRAAMEAGASAPRRRQVIWAPHFTVSGFNQMILSTYLELGLEIIDVMREFSDINFIVLPHPNLEHAVASLTQGARKVHSQIVAKVASLSNAEWVNKSDTVAYIVQSDGLITDCLSFLVDAIYAEKPLLYLDRPDRTRLSVIGESVINGHERTSDAAGVRQFLFSLSSNELRQNVNSALHEGQVHVSVPSQVLLDEVRRQLNAEK